MYARVTLAAKYLNYLFTASNGTGHGTHSPFIFNFIKNVLNNHSLYPEYRQVELLRHRLLHNDAILRVEELGAGSPFFNIALRKISDIAKRSAKPRKYGQLLFRVVQYYHPHNVIELGTSLGLSTVYLALGNRQAQVHTIEGAKEVAAVARTIFEQLKLTNIRAIDGAFEDKLPSLLNEVETVDLAFIDGNHRREPTLDYFRQLLPKVNRNSILIFDDIRWSAEMESAWQEIRDHEAVKATVDLFAMGFVFFKEEFKEKQHFTIRF